MTPPRHSDTGATALLVALCLLLLMGMAAISVDIGAAFDDRRQQQSAADVGALAAVQYANTNYGTPSPCTVGTLLQIAACRGGVEAMPVIAGTLNSRFTAADWTACVDSGDGSYPIDSGVSDCISYTSTLQKARVLLPTTQVGTTFGRVLGWTSISITSEAEAGADLNSSSDVIPFALGPTGAGANQSCLFANPTDNLSVAPCNGPVEGNFGFLDVALYGNATMNTSTTCSGDTQGRLATNIALGADHELTKWNAGDTVRNDRTYCPITTAMPNEVPTQTGGSNTGLENGFFRGSNGAEGRLMCKDGDAAEDNRFPRTSTSCTSILNTFPETVDNTPLWNYFDPNAFVESNGQCNGSVDTRQEMEACLTAWRAWGSHTQHLFLPSLIQATRFAATPQLVLDPSNGTGNYLITGFLPVYLETIYMGCNANTCDVVHSPGEPSSGACPPALLPTINTCGTPANGNKNLRAVTAFILRMDMLPSEIADHFPSRPGTVEFNLIK
jgi:Flp pilus assembly protein TadG